DSTLERNGEGYAVRLGLRLVRGLGERDDSIAKARSGRPFASIEDMWRRSKLSLSDLERLAEADAFGSIGLNRRDALWHIKGLGNRPLELFAAADDHEKRLRPEIIEPDVALIPMTQGREVVEDYRSKGLTLRRHPVAFLRHDLTTRRISACEVLKNARNGERITVGGIILVRQRPDSASGVIFITIEDETDIAKLIVRPPLFERLRRPIMSASMIACRGLVQRQGSVIHVVAEHMIDLSEYLKSVGTRHDPAQQELGLDETDASHQGSVSRDLSEPASIRIKTRDFR
ncbi:OB-fold nucleic acid binding domain-containing protein, partial [Streptomyces albidoflavus]|uniref:helix-hairpin-helix domain-containing protein n=1 Tax=Streptomyces albidoflavus TaxID=1886 RepID=UPI003418A380